MFLASAILELLKIVKTTIWNLWFLLWYNVIYFFVKKWLFKLGIPILSFDEKGNKVWERELDIYGNVRKGDNHFIPFLYQGQYYDEETGLAYNRFRYYNPETGGCISQDPIGLGSGEPNFYATEVKKIKKPRCKWLTTNFLSNKIKSFWKKYYVINITFYWTSRRIFWTMWYSS